MKLACFSDIHGNLTALDAALADLGSLGGADHLWFLGDLAAMGPRPADCIRRVRAIVDAVKDDEAKKGTVRVIYGNTDRYLVYGSRMPLKKPAENVEEFEMNRRRLDVANRMLTWSAEQITFEDYQFLATLPPECELHVPGYGYVCGYHAVPGDDEAYLTPESTDEEAADFLLDREGRLSIGGHIHRQFDRTLEGRGWRVINDGAVGMSFDKPGVAQWALVTFEAGEAHVDLRTVPFDVDAVVAQAREAGHPTPEWLEYTLRSGRR
ncbi:MAG: metallophosphoesterase [Anaerolineae bacterium]|nr:metallophosphoesterase [Anaerolineae bacterium]NUQ06955.1 metallophosphoesterase [Anaerolineae bacterium]